MATPTNGLTLVIHPALEIAKSLVNFIIQRFKDYSDKDIELLTRFQNCWREAYKATGNFANEVAILQDAAESFRDERGLPMSPRLSQCVIDELADSLEEDGATHFKVMAENDEKNVEECPALLEFASDHKGPKLIYGPEALKTLHKKFGTGQVALQLKAASGLIEQYYLNRLQRLRGSDKGSRNDPISQLCMALIFKLTELSKEIALPQIYQVSQNPLIVFFHLINKLFAEREVTQDTSWFAKAFHNAQDQKDFDQVIADVRTHVAVACLTQEIEKISQGASQRFTQLKKNLETLSDALFDLIHLVFAETMVPHGTSRQTILQGTFNDKSQTWLSTALIALARWGIYVSEADKEFIIFEIDPDINLEDLPYRLTGMMPHFANLRGIELFNQLSLLFQQMIMLQYRVALALSAANRGSDLALFGEANNAENLQKIARLLSLRSTTEDLLGKAKQVLQSFTKQTRALSIHANKLHTKLARDSKKASFPGWTYNYSRYANQYEVAQNTLISSKAVIKKLQNCLANWDEHQDQILSQAQLDIENLKQQVSRLPERVITTVLQARAYNQKKAVAFAEAAPSISAPYPHEQTLTFKKAEVKTEENFAEPTLTIGLFDSSTQLAEQPLLVHAETLLLVKNYLAENYLFEATFIHSVTQRFLKGHFKDKALSLSHFISKLTLQSEMNEEYSVNTLTNITHTIQALQNQLAEKEDGIFTWRKSARLRRAVIRALRLALLDQQITLLEKAITNKIFHKATASLKNLTTNLSQYIHQQRYFWARKKGERAEFNLQLTKLQQRCEALFNKNNNMQRPLPPSALPASSVAVEPCQQLAQACFNKAEENPAALPNIRFRMLELGDDQFLCVPLRDEMPQDRELKAQILVYFLQKLMSSPLQLNKLIMARKRYLARKQCLPLQATFSELDEKIAHQLWEHIDKPLRNRANEYVEELVGGDKNEVDNFLRACISQMLAHKLLIKIEHMHFLIQIAGSQGLRDEWNHQKKNFRTNKKR